MNITNHFGKSEIDLFVSRKYVSWVSKQEATAINAFSMTWGKTYFYMFPPFIIIGHSLVKVLRGQTNAVIVAPGWNTQYWYPQLMQMAEGSQMFIEPDHNNLLLTHKPEEIHPL